MSFITDKQTLDDLNIFEKKGHYSIYEIFNHTSTRGGAQLLETMFRVPLSDVESIRNRSDIIRFFQKSGKSFPISSNVFDTAEYYLANTDERSGLSHDEGRWIRMFRSVIHSDTEYQLLYKGILAIREILFLMHGFANDIQNQVKGTAYENDIREIQSIITNKDWSKALSGKLTTKFSFDDAVYFDRLFRFTYPKELKKLLYLVYSMDVFMTVAGVAKNKGYSFPEVFEQDDDIVSFDEVYHPALKNAIPNSLDITPDSNIVFLTGANMAGKSTLMKSLAIALYLAHMGFPVPARGMKFSVRDGLLTSINLADNLNMGYSHFFAEVLRVKKMAGFVGGNKRFFFIVDELFRGTNVKDAYDATVAITSSFSKKRNCMFVVSTHIMEAGDTLGELHNNINFVCLPTLMEDEKPVYTYRLQPGITSERHGMVIVNNEGIMDILKKGVENPNAVQQGFNTDKQTMNDLNIPGKYKVGSVFSLFNQVKTNGAERLLDNMFKEAMTDYEAINRRSSTFAYFQKSNLTFPFSRDEFSQMERFLLSAGSRSLIRAGFHALRLFLLKIFGLHQEYNLFLDGFRTSVKLLNKFYIFLDILYKEKEKNPFFGKISNLYDQFNTRQFQQILLIEESESISLFRLTLADHQLRDNFRTIIGGMFDLLFQIDLCIAVSDVARSRGFCYATALPEGSFVFRAKGLFHPSLEKAIPNDLELTKEKNLIFLTGANMAGKSTLMKSVGIASFLAHIGFPVPAEELQFSVRNGLYSSINVSDNIDLGYSHFYAEVVRVKQVAEQVASGKNMFVLFDELFKGTNVKDAYDATLAVTEAFSTYRNCFFIISTHIIEVGNALEKSFGNIRFQYLPTVMEGAIPKYTYKLKDGITDDRQGMIIIRNEGILETIDSGS